MEVVSVQADFVRQCMRLTQQLDTYRTEAEEVMLDSASLANREGAYSLAAMNELPTNLNDTAFSTFPPRSITFRPIAGTKRYAISFFDL